MRRLFPTPVRKWMQRHEKGQSLIFLALGFLGLIAFIGITADVAVLFARYSQLTRAVDSAAISAANQLREDREYPHVRLAATQFIEFYGLDPEQVDVQYYDTLLPDPETVCGSAEPDELCDRERKLVRVTARITVNTIFGVLPFWPDFIELEASSVSETAALDIVVIMDVSESMLRYTSVEDWANIGEGVIYRPPTIDEISARKGGSYYDYPTPYQIMKEGGYGGGDPLLYRTQADVNAQLSYVGDGINDYGEDSDFRVDVDTQFFTAMKGTTQVQPRDECRVRWFPGSYFTGVSSNTGYYDETTESFVNLRDLYQEAGLSWPTGSAGAAFGGFVPTYNFYGCCNDPDGDDTFEDLICQPFLQAREATSQFIERIDFARGDRVAFVTFDRGAFLVNPYGLPQGMPPAEAAEARPSPMITDAEVAQRLIRELLGVRAEPNFYVYEPGDFNPATVAANGLEAAYTAGWNGFAAGIDNNGESIVFNPNKDPYDPEDPSIPEVYNYPVRNNCPFMNAALGPGQSIFNSSLLRISNPLGNEWNTYVDPAVAGDGRFLWQGANPGPRTINLAMSYEYWSSCRGTNIGAALRVANNALVDPDTIRSEGVWIMVLLSDGGAGASDAVRRNGNKVDAANPYFDRQAQTADGLDMYGQEGEYGAFGVCPSGNPTNPPDTTAELMEPGDDNPEATFPHCSDEEWYTRHRCDFRPLRVARGQTNAMQDADYDDTQSEEWNLERNNLYDIDIGQPGVTCDVAFYDVDDYARDWADVIGLQQIAGGGGEAQLPTIFTIGFGLEFSERDNGTGTDLDITDQNNAVAICDNNPGDCLGEMLLRYIADVGDNNYLDNDYYQDLMFSDNDGTYANSVYLTNYNEGTVGDTRGYGDRGPCQTDIGFSVGGDYDWNRDGIFSSEEQADQREMLRPQLSCGNYYFAPDGNELRFVFDDIASRMYTRLAR